MCAVSTSADTNLPGAQVADAVKRAVKSSFSQALDTFPKKNLAVLFEGEQEAAFVIQLTTSAQNGQTFDLSARLFSFGLETDNMCKLSSGARTHPGGDLKANEQDTEYSLPLKRLQPQRATPCSLVLP